MSTVDETLRTAFGYRAGSADARSFRAALGRLMTGPAASAIGQLAGAPSLTRTAAASLRLPELLAPVMPLAGAVLAGQALSSRERALILAQLAAIESNSFIATVSDLGARYQREGNGRVLLTQLQTGLDVVLTQTEAQEARYGTYPHAVQGPVVGPLTAASIRTLYGQAGFRALFQRKAEGVNSAALFGPGADAGQASGLLRSLPPFTAGMILAGTHVFTNAAWHQPGDPQISQRNGGWYIGRPAYVAWDAAAVAASINGLAVSVLEIATRNATPALAAPELAAAVTIHTAVLGQALSALQDDVAALARPRCGGAQAPCATRMVASLEDEYGPPPPAIVEAAALVEGVAN